jgi:hypothetical protein
MLRLSIEELSALNLVLEFMSVSELLDAAMKGFAEEGEEKQIVMIQEKSDLCWKVLQSLK